MGKINTYQRRQLASSAVGVAPQDTSGILIGKSVADLGAILTKRQEALDTAQASTAYYQYATALNLTSMGLRTKYQQDPTLDLLSFTGAVKLKTEELTATAREKLPERLHGKFDLLASKANASQLIADSKWVFSQQNRNALEGFFELGEAAVFKAGDAMNPEDYLIGRSEYLETAESSKSTMTATSFEGNVNRVLKGRALTYWNNSIDFRNGGRPDQLAAALKEDPEFRKTLEKDMGSAELTRREKGLNSLVKNMIGDENYTKTVNDNEQLTERAAKLWDPTNDYGLKQISLEVEEEVNRLNYLTSINKEGLYDETIVQMQTNITNLKTLSRLAANVNDTSYASDLGTKAELQAEIRLAMEPYKSQKFKDKLAAIQADVSEQTAQQDLKRPWWQKIPLGPLAIPTLIDAKRVGASLLTGVPAEVRLESQEKIKASLPISQYMQDSQEVKGRVLQAIDDKLLTYKDGLNLLNDISMSTSAEQYDVLTTQKANWYTVGFDAFSQYSRALNLDLGTLENNRRFRDDVKTQMMDAYSKRVAFYRNQGIEVTSDKMIEMVKQVKYAKNEQLHPEVMGVKPGQFIRVDGHSVQFEGFDNHGGITVRSKALQKEIENR